MSVMQRLYDSEINATVSSFWDDGFYVTPRTVTDHLPTARAMLRQDAWLCLLVWCKACRHQAPADLQAIVDAGRGDVPLIELPFQCTRCGSRMTESVVTSEDAMRVTPWRSDELKKPRVSACEMPGEFLS
jgi:hypothetical protein